MYERLWLNALSQYQFCAPCAAGFKTGESTHFEEVCPWNSPKLVQMTGEADYRSSPWCPPRSLAAVAWVRIGKGEPARVFSPLDREVR
jgi:hypothetical protein